MEKNKKDFVIRLIAVIVKFIIIVSVISFAVAGLLSSNKDTQTDYFIMSTLIWIANLFFNPYKYGA